MAVSWALRIFDAATICIALVICAVLLMDLIRRRKSRVLCITNRSQESEVRSQNVGGAHMAGFGRHPQIAEIHLQVSLNCSAAAFNSSVKPGLSAFS